MSDYKEIVTKAVVGKGKKSFKNKYEVEVEDTPSNILGCWIINHKFNGYQKDDSIIVDGSYDVNIWYSTDNDTKTEVAVKKIDYKEEIAVNSKIDANSGEVIVRALKQPTVENTNIKNNMIDFDIEKELGIEVVADTKVKILTEEEDDNWQIFDDDDEVDKQIDEEVNEDVIEDNS